MTTRRAKQQLPHFIEPMLAKAGAAFDSDDHLFEIKWDGTRTLAFVEKGSYRLVNRRQFDTADRYPELAFLKALPSGTVLDGEIVVMHEGRPDFPRLLGRENCRSELKIRLASRSTPVTFIAFDLLYCRHKSIMDDQLIDRREQLYQTTRGINDSRFVVSEGVIGCGKLLFEQTTARELEGIVAKRLNGRYQPGKRSDAWIKVKRRSKLPCVVVGFVPAGRNDLQNLLLAAQTGDGLRYVGNVGTGLSDRLRAALCEQLRAIVVDGPVVRCRGRATWVQPEIYCWVSYLELTRGGEMRDPVFEDLITEPIGA